MLLNGDKKSASNVFKEWARLLNYEAALLKGVVDSDRKRYKSYQRNGKVKDAKEEIADAVENEIVLPEETFDLVESED